MGQGVSAGVSSENKASFSDFKSAVESAPNYDGVSWRGIRLEGSTDDILRKFSDDIGSDLTFDTYSSASASAQTASGFALGRISRKPVMFEMYSNKGKYINSKTAFGSSGGGEHELIFQPNVAFRIKDAYIGQVQIGLRFDKPVFEDTIFVVMEDING